MYKSCIVYQTGTVSVSVIRPFFLQRWWLICQFTCYINEKPGWIPKSVIQIMRQHVYHAILESDHQMNWATLDLLDINKTSNSSLLHGVCPGHTQVCTPG